VSATVGSIVTIVGFAVRESLRRRVFAVVLVLSLAFLALYAVGAHFAFRDAHNFGDPEQHILDPKAFTGATIFGLAMFATLFLGSVLAVFLTLGVVRGDAESGLLQPIAVRPIGRSTFLLARFAGAAGLSAAYVMVIYSLAVLITELTGQWSPDHLVGPALGLALGVSIVAALSLLASIYLSSNAQGIAVFMVFGAGLTAGLLGQIGRAIDSPTLHSIGRAASWALPFDALYSAGLHALISNTGGLTGVVLQLGPFGGSEGGGPLLVGFSVLYVAAALGLGARAFARRDL
jgi:Cu-processing system permease protein